MLEKIMACQDPLQIYKERMERMKLVSIAPLIFIIGLSTIYLCVLYFDKGVLLELKLVNNAFLISFAWFLVIGYLIRQEKVKTFLKHTSTIFRFLFDLPILLLSLAWIIHCFNVINIYEYPFFITFYVLSVYSASQMVKIPLYSFATNMIGVLLILFFAYFRVKWFSQAGFFEIKDILENFGALYIGLYYNEIQSLLIYLINAIMRFVKYVFATLLEEP